MTPPVTPTPTDTVAVTTSITVVEVLPDRVAASEGDTAVALSSIFSPVGTRAIVGTTLAVAGVGALAAAPAVAGQAVRVSFIASGARCGFADSATTAPYAELPLQFALDASQYATYTGGLLLTTLILVVLPVIVLYALAHANAEAGKLQIPRLLVGILTTLCISYFVPAVVKNATYVLVHSPENVDILLALVMGLLSIAVAGVLVFGALDLPNHVIVRRVPRAMIPTYVFFPSAKEVDRKPPYGFAPTAANEKGEPPSIPYIESFGVFFTPTRDPRKEGIRMVFFCELGCSIMMGILAGIRPESGECRGIAISLLVVALLLAGYLLVVRPYRTKLDTVFSMCAAITTVAIAALVVVIAFDPTIEIAGKLMAAEVFFLCIIIVLQAISSPLWSRWRSSHRDESSTRRRRAAVVGPEQPMFSEKSSAPPPGEDEELAVPILAGSLSEAPRSSFKGASTTSPLQSPRAVAFSEPERYTAFESDFERAEREKEEARRKARNEITYSAAWKEDDPFEKIPVRKFPLGWSRGEGHAETSDMFFNHHPDGSVSLPIPQLPGSPVVSHATTKRTFEDVYDLL